MLRRMHDPNQGAGDEPSAKPNAAPRDAMPDTPGSSPAAEAMVGDAARDAGESASPAEIVAPGPWPDAAATLPRQRPEARGLAVWFVVIALGGALGLLTEHGDLSMLLALAGLLVAARAADLDRGWYLFHLAVQWIVPIGGLLGAFGLGAYAVSGTTSRSAVTWIVSTCALAAFASVVLLVPVFTHRIAVLMFRREHTTRVMRLTARIVVLGLALAPPLAMLWPDLLRFLQESGQTLADASSLVSGLAGEIAIAFAAVGLGLDRGWRASFERLGLQPMRGSHVLVAVSGLAALTALNSLLEYLQSRWFPALAAADRATVEWMVRGFSPELVLVLGVSAGVGEEIAMRGALQPRLGLVLTSLLFAALHVQYTWFGILTVALIGLLLGIIRQRTNTTTAIVVHGSYDVLVALVTPR